MKLLIVFGVTILVLTTFVEAKEISQLLQDRRYVERQIRCILNEGHCDIIGKTVKELLPEALNDNCRHCTSRQREHAQTLMAFTQRNYPNEWLAIVQQYGRM
ncbi:PREDICTED: ejaculatory bulb-specific protein 3-like [Dufourea novaeangliae]|uniref:Ejaculatory bulb-specific protein 3 n=1 Tax=Dufourea novaeangliae TaxID=178035 RepID=A0A154NX42_DUFNO|nr:PREDICTED: ejaculatory bulb-specific protein 3-like [Dufourea novaeangliae]KZC04255.1 Ejaculatory bulb-specific protein 3 [Dufourea novaeangliae]